MSLMTSLTMMVLGPGLPENLVYLVRALFIPDISVDSVCGLSGNGVTKPVCRVSGICSV